MYSGFKNLKIGSRTRLYDVSLSQADGTQEFDKYNLRSGRLVPWLALAGYRRIKELYATPGQAEKVLCPDFICTNKPEKAHFYCCGVSADSSRSYMHHKFNTILKDK